jgi:hypothetical protein
MRTDLISDLFHHLNSAHKLGVGKCDKATHEKLERLEIPMDLRRTLQWYWTTLGGEVGGYELHSVNSIFQHEDFKQLSKYKMIPIGSAANGDILVINYQQENPAIGLVSHDELWESKGNPLEVYEVVTASIDEYLFRAVEKMYLPIDYYAARELNALKREMKSQQPV